MYQLIMQAYIKIGRDIKLWLTNPEGWEFHIKANGQALDELELILPDVAQLMAAADANYAESNRTDEDGYMQEWRGGLARGTAIWVDQDVVDRLMSLRDKPGFEFPARPQQPENSVPQ
jgi:hypothetical protein